MNKHTEAIIALQPFASLLTNIEDLAQSCSSSFDEETTFLIPINLSDLLEASRVMRDWTKKHSDPPKRQAFRCRTCGEMNYYENLDEETRCEFCQLEMKLYLMFSEVERKEEKGTKRKKKTTNIYEKMARELKAMDDEELGDFLKAVPVQDAVLYRKLMMKF